MERAEILESLIPEYSKYSVVIMPLKETLNFTDEPNPEWPKKDVLVSKKDITRVFDNIRDNEAIFVNCPTTFIPYRTNGIKVYFNPRDTNSLFIVAESRKIANEYVEGIKLRKPYSESELNLKKSLLHSLRF